MMKKKINTRVFNGEVISKPNNFFYRLSSSQRFLAIVGLIFLLLIIIPLAKTYSQRRLVEKEIADVQKEIAEFESNNQELQEMIAYLESDQSLEEQARLNLNLKKPGEEVIIIEDKDLKKSQFQESSNQKQVSNFVKWWNYFFN